MNARATGVLAVVALAAGIAFGHLVSRAAQPALAPAAAAPAPAAPASDVTRYQVPVTITQPTKGPADALVTIVEWCDFQSAACKDLDPVVGRLLDDYGPKLRLVFRHFTEPTPEAQQPHEFVHIAFVQADKFWQAKTLVQEAKAPLTFADYERFSKQLGLDWNAVRPALDARTHAGQITGDRLFASLFDVSAVPALFVNGRRLEGPPTQAGLKQLIDDELARAGQLVAKGIPKDQVYAELIRNGIWNKSKLRRN